MLSVKYANMLTIVAILLDHECARLHKKLPVLRLFPISTQRLQGKHAVSSPTIRAVHRRLQPAVDLHAR